MLTDTDAIARISDNLRQQDKGLWEKIKDWLQGLVEKLKNAYKDLTPGSTIAQQTRSIVAQSEEILNAWVDVATDAVVNYNLQDGQKNNTPGEVRLSERERSNAKSLVEQIRENISDINEIGSVATITGKEIRKDIRPTDAAMEFVKTFGGTIMRDGFGEVRFSKGKVKSGLVGHGMGVAKLDTFAAVPDVIRKGVQIGFAENWKGRQKDSFVFAAPVTYLGETAYVGVIVERDIQSNMYYVHEVVDSEGNVFAWSNKKEEPTSDRLLAANGSLDTVVDSSTNSISSNSQNVNPEDTLYSSRNVQQTKNLVALHNITEDKFLKTLELGGFPMPSIAITKADIPHTNFGDITVVFGRETIDPKANRKNTVYSADAWTPTVPQVEYEADSKATSRVYISDETAMAAKELLFDISQMPVNIFEAKPERAVEFEEIKTVLVPDTASQKLLQELDSRGIPYQTYQAGNEEQRHQMVQDMEDIRFSQRSAAQLERENEQLRRDKEYLKELVKIQRQGNTDVVPTRASVNNIFIIGVKRQQIGNGRATL